MTPWSGRSAGSRRDPHGWNSLDNFLTVHDAYLARLTEAGDIVGHELDERWAEPTMYRIHGCILCRGQLFVDVDKHLETNHTAVTARVVKVRTAYYSYHAGLVGNEDRCAFRYDNAHPYLIEGHPDAHHKHRFDHTTWREIEPPEWIGEHRWPHLDQVITELMEWWDAQGRELVGG